ncbi:hypothetical protein N752_11105 [Desulforamulus aquiferis]|nr:hypothetical protein N752_11105 [Desulforamulus aquiferis]
MKPKFKRVPKHIGIIPDGNRRWAEQQGMPKESGYSHGIDPGLALYETCVELGIPEVTFYGFTQDNTKRPSAQKLAFQQACIDAVNLLSNRDASLLVIGNTESPQFPKELLPYTVRQTFGKDLIKINFLVNYGWKWDLANGLKSEKPRDDIHKTIASRDISRIDLIVRWGGRRRLSGFLPVQSIYADFYVVDDYWPILIGLTFMTP